MEVVGAAFIGVEDADAGLTGGIVETAREIGGAFGTAVVATLVIARTDDVLAGNAMPLEALTEGFQRGMLVAAGLSLTAALATALLLRPAERRAAGPGSGIGTSTGTDGVGPRRLRGDGGVVPAGASRTGPSRRPRKDQPPP